MPPYWKRSSRAGEEIMPFTKEHRAALRAKLQTIGPKTDNLLLKFVAHQFVQDKAREYARHGFARRIQTLRRCIENVFKIVSPGVAKSAVEASAV
jgi:hypothetical protein